jgi:hypothetical protein
VSDQGLQLIWLLGEVTSALLHLKQSEFHALYIVAYGRFSGLLWGSLLALLLKTCVAMELVPCEGSDKVIRWVNESQLKFIVGI